ncbi:unnamed protein product, partial [Closterium sp. NIES-54]
PVAPPCSCRLLSHQTLLTHHCLGHPSLPRLRGMHSRLLVSCLPRSLPPLPPSPAPPCLPCIEGRQRAAPHSSSFPPTTAPLQTLHMDVPSQISYLRLHTDRGGEFSSDLLRDFCRGEGILHTFMLPASLQQNGIVERRIGLVMEVARTSMIHAAAPHFLWSFAVRYDAHQLNLWPRVSLPETSPTLHWTGKVYDASVFRGPAPSDVSQVDPLPGTVPVEVAVDSDAASGGSASGDVEPAGAGFWGGEPAGAEPGGTEPEGAKHGGPEPEVAEPGGAESEGAEFGGVEPSGIASSRGPAGASPQLSPRPEPLSPQQLREWFAQRTRVRSGAARARDSAAGGTGAGGAGATSPGGARVPAGAGGTGGARAAGPGGARTRGTRAARAGGVGGAEAGGARAGGTGAGDAGARGAGAGDPGTRSARAGGTGSGGAGAEDAGAVDPRAGGAGAGGATSRGTGAGGTVQRRPFFVPPPPSSLPPLDSVLHQTDSFTEHRQLESRPASPICVVRTGRRIPRPRPPPFHGTHVMALRPTSVPLRIPLPHPPESSLPAVLDPKSDLARAASPTVPRLLATVVTDPSFESTAASALVAELVEFAIACRLDYVASLVAESESNWPPSVGGEFSLSTNVLEDRQEEFECLAAAVPHLVDMLLGPEGDPDAPDIQTPRSYVEAITGPYSSQWQTALDADMASWKSTGTYVDAVPPSGANIVDGMWIFTVKRPPGSPPVFKARYIARGFTQRDYELHSLDFCTAFLQGSLHEEIWLRRPPGFTRSFPAGTQWSLWRPVYGLRQAPCKWHHTLRTTLAALGFAHSTADPSLFLRTDTLLLPFYVLLYVDDLVFAIADTEALALVKSELQKRHTCTDLGELRSYLGLQITWERARHTITLTQSHMVHHVLQRFGFWYSSPHSTPLPTGHSLSAPPLDDSVEPSGPHRPEHWEAAKRVLRYLCSTSGMGLVLGGRGPVVLTGHADASWVDDLASQRSSQGYTFSLGSGSVS